MARKRRRSSDAGLRGLRDGRLSYGQPVSVNGRTVITVTRVRMARAGRGTRTVESSPLGFIEVSAEGSVFHPIDDPAPGRAMRAVAAATVTTVAGAIAGARALRASGHGQRLLPPGRPRLHR